MKKKRTILIILILLTLISFSYLTSFARYSSNYVWNYYLESHGFYLTSDFLGLDKKNINTLWDGNSVHFNIKNFSNNNLITDYDIRLDVTCEVLNGDPYICKLNGTESSSLNLVLSANSQCINNVDDVDTSGFSKTECELGGYTWQVLAVNQDAYFTLTSTNGSEINNANVKITVRSTSPYRKTITGIFNLFKNSKSVGEIIKQVNDNELYDELVITNSYNIRKCILVTFNSSTRTVDKTNDMLNITTDNNDYIDSFKIVLDGKTNKKIRFYNKDLSSNYQIDDFVVSESSGCF